MGETYTSWKESGERPKMPRGIGFGKSPPPPRGEPLKQPSGALEGVTRAILDSVYLQGAITGKRVGVPNGSPTEAGLFFHGPPDQSVQDPGGTGIYRSTTDTLGISAGGLAQLLVDTAKVLMMQELWIKSGTAFNGKMKHTNTADRTWVFPDASGTVALTTGITPVERKESHVVLFLEYPEHTC